MDMFNWQGETWAAGGSRGLNLTAMYYNKRMFREAGLSDPWELYQQGEWTWDKMMEMAREVNDPASDIFFLEGLRRGITIMCYFGIPAINLTDGIPSSNISSAEFRNGLEFAAEITSGPGKIHGDTDDLMFSGHAYMRYAFINAFDSVFLRAGQENSFQSDSSNLGMVPAPLPPINTRGYPGNGPLAWAIGRGTQHKTAAVELAVYDSIYQMAGNYLTPEHKQAFTELHNDPIFLTPTGFHDSDRVWSWSIVDDILISIREGGDLAASIQEHSPRMLKVISDTIESMEN
jgi:ABC-type glycerol-3-phosphate transport system substrate-binding protein